MQILLLKSDKTRRKLKLGNVGIPFLNQEGDPINQPAVNQEGHYDSKYSRIRVDSQNPIKGDDKSSGSRVAS